MSDNWKFALVLAGCGVGAVVVSVLSYAAIAYGLLWVLRHFGVLEALGI